MNTTKAPKLEISSNYASFTPNDEQRPIIERHVSKLAEIMAKMGFLPSKPIQCFKKGSKYVLIDGHHRLAAAKRLGISFYFVVEPESHADTMASVNANVKTWVTADFVRMHSLRGIPDFENLMRYSEVGIPMQMAASMLHGHAASSGNVGELIKQGTFKIRQTTDINRIYKLIVEFGKTNPVVKHRPFIAALSKCMLTPDFDYDRFMRRFEESPMMIQKASNEDLQLAQIEELYNFRSREKVPLAFLVKSNSAKRNAKAMGPKR
jgi:hypothetical protein